MLMLVVVLRVCFRGGLTYSSALLGLRQGAPQGAQELNCAGRHCSSAW